MPHKIDSVAQNAGEIAAASSGAGLDSLHALRNANALPGAGQRDADAFEAFVENGIFDRATGQSFRDNILSKGGSEDPMTLYKRFRGAEPDPVYLLKDRGFIK